MPLVIMSEVSRIALNTDIRGECLDIPSSRDACGLREPSTTQLSFSVALPLETQRWGDIIVSHPLICVTFQPCLDHLLGNSPLEKVRRDITAIISRSVNLRVRQVGASLVPGKENCLER